MATKTTKKTAATKATKSTKAALKKAGKVKVAPEAAPATTKPAKATKAKPSDGKLSALDAAAKVLAESKVPLNAKQMIDAMATKGYWTSPGGKTPHATLYSALIREINVKGNNARFMKTERGHFTTNG